VGVAAGLVALIIPGLVLLTYWSMVTPAIVLEKRGVRDALRRSWRLVRGDALRVFVVIVVTVVAATLISVVTTQLLGPLPDGVDNFVATVLANAITVPFVALTWTVMYFELRLNRDPNAIPWATGSDGSD
jgi:membrane-anchored glycerophosphoryl diester phosphodiesterase (GDPDase)